MPVFLKAQDLFCPEAKENNFSFVKNCQTDVLNNNSWQDN